VNRPRGYSQMSKHDQFFSVPIRSRRAVKRQRARHRPFSPSHLVACTSANFNLILWRGVHPIRLNPPSA